MGLINENTAIIAHSIALVFVSKFLIEHKVKVKKLIFVCGFNNYLGINEDYDTVNGPMYLYNDPYVKYEVEKDFADKIATKQVVIENGGYINSETGCDTFEEILSYI